MVPGLTESRPSWPDPALMWHRGRYCKWMLLKSNANFLNAIKSSPLAWPAPAGVETGERVAMSLQSLVTAALNAAGELHRSVSVSLATHQPRATAHCTTPTLGIFIASHLHIIFQRAPEQETQVGKMWRVKFTAIAISLQMTKCFIWWYHSLAGHQDSCLEASRGWDHPGHSLEKSLLAAAPQAPSHSQCKHLKCKSST